MPAKISELEQAHTLGGQEEYEVVQDGESRRSTANDLKAFIAAAVNAGIFSAGLISERPEADGGQGIYVATDSTERRFYFDLEGAWVDIGLDALDKQKLDGIESGATADQTGSEIKSAYESQPDTNAYTDAEKASVAGLGTASTYDVGTAPGEVPANSDLGTASTYDVGTAPGEIPTNADISGGGSSLEFGSSDAQGGSGSGGWDPVDFTAIPAGVKMITVFFNDALVPGSGRLIVQLGKSSGIVTSGYLSSSTRTDGSDGDTFSSFAGFVINSNYPNYFKGHMTITRWGETSNSWVSSHVGSGTDGKSVIGGGRLALGATLTSLRITFIDLGDGTVPESGFFNILYE